MRIIKNFVFCLDKSQILSIVETYLPYGDKELRGKIFDELIDLLKLSVEPVGFFSIGDKTSEYNFETLKQSEKLVYCLITLGGKITEKIDLLFSENNFEEAIILDVMASSLLFEYNSQMYDYLYDYFVKKGYGITCRIAPGDGEIPMEYQGDIINKLAGIEKYNISLKKGYVIYPPKSLAYIHGIGKNLNKDKHLYSCRECPNINCSIRIVKEKARGIFKK
ncbi:hypothetical protein Q3V94_03075 [Caloramator sp. CAR-1]|uniref:hypothetical protein n=1 Tax=Caloramator sp. CAR-1 TaxID=3062777 RepID=UPI0026E1B3D5|nr:hypothetical protein [Caloramator sp. CAR-1]MDO6354068.1 hypothetical protein [Caloramator sp. CAR-1]